MDFLSRDRQRQAVEELGGADREAQVRVALRADRKRAPGCGSRTDDRSRQRTSASTWSVRDGSSSRPTLAIGLAFQSASSGRCLSFPTLFYLGSVAAITSILIGLGVAYVRYNGGAPDKWFWIGLLLIVPASEVAIS